MKPLQRELEQFVDDHQLPDAYARLASAYFLPLADDLLARLQQSGDCAFVLGIYGAQGSGKSTLADLLSRCIAAAGKTVLSLSLDDFYLTRKERAQLAANISPLLATRGPPGTHDVALALETLQRATTLANGDTMAVPRFDKATDDRVAAAAFDNVSGPVDLVILEGWCLGCTPVDAAELAEPINDLERVEDSDGAWRRFVNDSIAAYQPLFDRIDDLIMLKTEKFEAILQWRSLQEEKLRTATHSPAGGIMGSAELARFVQFFERVSRNTEAQLEHIANVVFTQDEQHRVTHVRRN